MPHSNINGLALIWRSWPMNAMGGWLRDFRGARQARRGVNSVADLDAGNSHPRLRLKSPRADFNFSGEYFGERSEWEDRYWFVCELYRAADREWRRRGLEGCRGY